MLERVRVDLALLQRLVRLGVVGEHHGLDRQPALRCLLDNGPPDLLVLTGHDADLDRPVLRQRRVGSPRCQRQPRGDQQRRLQPAAPRPRDSHLLHLLFSPFRHSSPGGAGSNRTERFRHLPMSAGNLSDSFES